MYRGRGKRRERNYNFRKHSAKNVSSEENINPDLLETRKVYVGNLSNRVGKVKLTACFQRFVEVEEAFVVKNGCYGFVSVFTEEDVTKLLELNGTVLDISAHNAKPIIIRRAKKNFKLPGKAGYKRSTLSDREFDLEPLHPDKTTIHVLFDELIFRIYDFLSVKEIIACEQVCRRWQVLVYHYFNDNYKAKIEKSIGSFFTENGLPYNIRSFSKTLILCGESLSSLDVLGTSFDHKSNFSRIIAQLCPSLEVLGLFDFKDFSGAGLNEIVSNCRDLRIVKIEESYSFNDDHLAILFGLSKLEVLNLSEVGIKGSCFSKLPKQLKELSLVDCQICLENINLIPEKCPNLEICNVGGNCSNETTFNKFASCPKLRDLTVDLGFCPVMKLKCLPNLKVLHLSGQFASLNPLVESIPVIEELDLSLIDFDDDYNGLSFSSLGNLSKLTFPTSDMNCVFNPSFLNSILQCQKLEFLDLGCYDENKFILEYIQKLPLLRELRCTNFTLTSSDIPKFISSNKKRNHMLTLCLQIEDESLINYDELKKANLTIQRTASFDIFSYQEHDSDFWNDYYDFGSDLSNYSDYDYDPFDDFYNPELYPEMFLEFMDFL